MKYFQRFRHCAWVLFAPGIFTLVSACDKGKRNPAPVALSALDSTHKLAGTWVMHGVKDSDQIDVFDSTFAVHDTAITITVVNDSTISVSGTLLNYVLQSSDDSMLYFWQGHQWAVFEESSVSYYFGKDSIVYDYLVLPTLESYEDFRYNSYR